MSTQDPGTPLTLDEARARVAETSFPDTEPTDGPGLIGLEPELFAYHVADDGKPAGRVRLRQVLEVLDEFASNGTGLRSLGTQPPKFMLEDGGSLTFEPGGQIEHSTRPYSSGAEALQNTRDVFCTLQSAFRPHKISLASSGVDLFSTAADVPQQLDAPRYHCMAEYFDRRGPHGRTMMRLTASQQVNLDVGQGSVRTERWNVAMLASPLAAASFATSPAEDLVNARAVAWQGLDPTRSGYPASFVDGSTEDPVEQYARAALSADVMMFRRNDTATPGTPGFDFETWIRDGHPEHGPPTLEDFDYHLTTLFFEVRPRGSFEIRSTDALPSPWLNAPVVLWTGLLYDDRARGLALEVLEPMRSRLPELWASAARVGFRDSEIAVAASRVWDVALEGARRLPEGYFTSHGLETAESFLDTFVRQQRSPSDQLREALAKGTCRALAWAVGDPRCPGVADGLPSGLSV